MIGSVNGFTTEKYFTSGTWKTTLAKLYKYKNIKELILWLRKFADAHRLQSGHQAEMGHQFTGFRLKSSI